VVDGLSRNAPGWGSRDEGRQATRRSEFDSRRTSGRYELLAGRAYEPGKSGGHRRRRRPGRRPGCMALPENRALARHRHPRWGWVISKGRRPLVLATRAPGVAEDVVGGAYLLSAPPSPGYAGSGARFSARQRPGGGPLTSWGYPGAAVGRDNGAEQVRFVDYQYGDGLAGADFPSDDTHGGLHRCARRCRRPLRRLRNGTASAVRITDLDGLNSAYGAPPTTIHQCHWCPQPSKLSNPRAPKKAPFILAQQQHMDVVALRRQGSSKESTTGGGGPSSLESATEPRTGETPHVDPEEESAQRVLELQRQG
jgi:hypothetical protein